jgi:endogenous inhibitor of DNA gyrase (YacG/DUF329 family)
MAIQMNEKYCPICGKPVGDPIYNRFGEFCCSEAHAEEYVKEVRGRRVQATTGTPDRQSDEQSRPSRFSRRGCC